MSDNIDEILKLKSADGAASAAAPPLLSPASLRVPPKLPHVISTFQVRGVVAFITFIAVVTAASAVILAFIALGQWDSSLRRTLWYLSLVCFGSAMSLFISAHVIKTIEKCAFYLENLNKKN